MKEVNIGTIFIPDSMVAAVEKHREYRLEYTKDSLFHDPLLREDFSYWVADYLLFCANYHLEP